VPAIKLSGSTPARKSAPKRKPAAKSAPKRKPAAAKSAPKRKPVAAQAAPADTNGGATRGPKLPEGWTQRDFNGVVKEMRKAKQAREKAEADLKAAQEAANGMALELLDEGIQMSVISTELELSRQWMYTMLKQRYEREGIVPPTTPRNSKPAAKKRAAKKPAAAAKRSPARKAPAAKKAPARKRPASKPAPTAGRGRVRIAR
jgi:hypothetical protein